MSGRACPDRWAVELHSPAGRRGEARPTVNSSVSCSRFHPGRESPGRSGASAHRRTAVGQKKKKKKRKKQQLLRTRAAGESFPETGSRGGFGCWPSVPRRQRSSLRSSSAAGSRRAPQVSPDRQQRKDCHGREKLSVFGTNVHRCVDGIFRNLKKNFIYSV